jgi:hypothetical protein
MFQTYVIKDSTFRIQNCDFPLNLSHFALANLEKYVYSLTLINTFTNLGPFLLRILEEANNQLHVSMFN